MQKKIRLTKQFGFEAAHALYNYNGKCCRLHGHSYKLFVTVSSKLAVQLFFVSAANPV